MKNKKLIEKLSKFNLDANVSLINSSDICISYISENGDTPKTTKQIFIEESNLCESCFFHDGGGYCTEYNQRCESVEECYQYIME